MVLNEFVAFCPHCGNTTPQKVVYTHSYEAVGFDMDGTRSEVGPDCQYFVCICATCSDLQVHHSFNDDRPELVYPKSPELHVSVPPQIRECYAEAARIRTTGPNAYAVMLRRGLEAVCDDRKVKKGLLHQRLEALRQKNEIPPKLAEITTVLRQLGNVGAHSAKTNVTVPMTWVMDDFFRAVVEYVYVAPSKVKSFRARLKSLGHRKHGASVKKKKSVQKT